MKKEIVKNYKDTDEYKSLVEDSQAIITEGVFRSRQELIDTYRQLGERIYTDFLYKKWGQNTQGRFMKELAKDIGKSIPVLYFAIQFYDKITNDKEFSTAVEKLGKNASWSKIRQLLPKPKKEKIELPKGKYQVIYADPPYPYPERQDEKNLYGNTKYHYKTMSIKEICDMPVKELATENSVLFLWVATNFLEESFEIIKSWGFEYKSQMVWVKKGGRGGIGWYCWGDHEILLIATRGSFLPKKLFSSVYQSPRERHSKKPDYYYGMIETMYPKTKKIELFLRGKPREGWHGWGDESQ